MSQTTDGLTDEHTHRPCHAHIHILLIIWCVGDGGIEVSIAMISMAMIGTF